MIRFYWTLRLLYVDEFANVEHNQNTTSSKIKGIAAFGSESLSSFYIYLFLCDCFTIFALVCPSCHLLN